MNAFQCLKQLQYLLQIQTWPDSPSGPVFAAVHVTQAPTDDAAQVMRYPLVLLRIMESSSDDQSPGLVKQRIEAVVVVVNTGDQVGEYAMVGGHRKSQGQSPGRGLLEVEEQLRNVINLANQQQGVRVYEVSSSAAEAGLVEGVGYVVTRAYTLEARLTTGRFYPSPAGGNKLGATVSGSTVTVTWAATPARFDAHVASTTPALAARGGLYLVRKTGGGNTVPASVTDGTQVLVGGAHTLTSYADTGVPTGTYVYGLFIQYDEFGDGTTSLRYSTTPATAAAVTV